MKWLGLRCGQVIKFEYKNHRGETTLRHVCVEGIDFGENEWYSAPTWFLRCWDYDKQAVRSFALSNIFTDTIQVG